MAPAQTPAGLHMMHCVDVYAGSDEGEGGGIPA